MFRKLMQLIVAVTLGVCTGAGMAQAQSSALPPAIIDAAYVQDALKRGVQVWDVRDARDYGRGHLPGAITIGDAAKALRDENAEDFIALARIEKIFSDAGLDPARETVVYGWRGTWNAYFGQYTLRYFGGTRVSVFHEGIEGWQQVTFNHQADFFGDAWFADAAASRRAVPGVRSEGLQQRLQLLTAGLKLHADGLELLWRHARQPKWRQGPLSDEETILD